MKFLRKYFKMLIGVAVIILALIVFFFAMRSNNLETGTLNDWRTATADARISVVQMLTASTDDLDLLVSCVNKMSTLEDAGNMAVRDAVSLCNIGLQLRQSM